MRLLRVELRRLRARRLGLALLCTVPALLALLLVGVAVSSSTPTSAQRVAAQRKADQANQAARTSRADCEQAQRAGRPAGYPRDCGVLTAYPATPDEYLPVEFVFHDMEPVFLMLTGGLGGLCAFAMGASFVGAECGSGGMALLLMWEPRRIRVLLAKLAALLPPVGGCAAALAVLVTAGAALVAATRGRFGTVTAGFVRSLVLTEVRVLALVLAAAVLGFGLAVLGRRTATALGVALGYAMAGEVLVPHVLEMLGIAAPERFSLSRVVTAWLNLRYRMQTRVACGTGTCTHDYVITAAQAAVVLSVLLLGVLVVAARSFRTRDPV